MEIFVSSPKSRALAWVLERLKATSSPEWDYQQRVDVMYSPYIFKRLTMEGRGGFKKKKKREAKSYERTEEKGKISCG